MNTVYVLIAALQFGSQMETVEVKTYPTVDACVDVQLNEHDETVKTRLREAVHARGGLVIAWTCLRQPADRRALPPPTEPTKPGETIL